MKYPSNISEIGTLEKSDKFPGYPYPYKQSLSLEDLTEEICTPIIPLQERFSPCRTYRNWIVNEARWRKEREEKLLEISAIKLVNPPLAAALTRRYKEYFRKEFPQFYIQDIESTRRILHDRAVDEYNSRNNAIDMQHRKALLAQFDDLRRREKEAEQDEIQETVIVWDIEFDGAPSGGKQILMDCCPYFERKEIWDKWKVALAEFAVKFGRKLLYDAVKILHKKKNLAREKYWDCNCYLLGILRNLKKSSDETRRQQCNAILANLGGMYLYNPATGQREWVTADPFLSAA